MQEAPTMPHRGPMPRQTPAFSLSMKWLKARFGADNVERTEWWNPYGKRAVDLWGFVDILVLDPKGNRLLAVQATASGNQQARIAKILDNPRALAFLQCGPANEILVHGWRLKGKGVWHANTFRFVIEKGKLQAQRVDPDGRKRN